MMITLNSKMEGTRLLPVDVRFIDEDLEAAHKLAAASQGLFDFVERLVEIPREDFVLDDVKQEARDAIMAALRVTA